MVRRPASPPRIACARCPFPPPWRACPPARHANPPDPGIGMQTSDLQLGYFCNLLGFSIVLLIVGYHYVTAGPKQQEKQA
mmetsp:Transcript_67697/g.214278  ORF Transcript_67697/g.214278 Transcript_67697/m.214278 type:complete len:80 (+) Transcript_67697:18-257(+)